ncbi:MAG: hypothetical protein II401_02680 [Bacteroidales bacterium]|nr:hypothetical protein [Bacteroidales bacterium]
MKTFGWVLIVFAILNFIVFLVAASSGSTDAAGGQIGAALLLGVLGAFLVHRGKQKEQEQKDREEWNKQ